MNTVARHDRIEALYSRYVLEPTPEREELMRG